MAQWRMKVFDPLIVLGQIFSSIALFYVFIGILVAFISFLTGSPAQLAFILNSMELQPESFVSWLLLVAFLIASLANAVGLYFLVQRAKQCFDFAVTIYLFHLLLCWTQYGFPTSPMWWFANISSLIITSVVGEYLCLKRELEPITLSGGKLGGAAGGNGGNGSTPE